MAKILSIDVGIKNLAYCLFEGSQIVQWDVVNLTTSTVSNISCCGKDKKQCACKLEAKYQDNKGSAYCAKHAKAHDTLKVPPLKDLSKYKMTELSDICAKHGHVIPAFSKKAEMISLLNSILFKRVEKINASKLDIVSVGQNIKSNFDAIFLDTIDCVIIENQISPIANRMKTVQGMIAQYFIMKNPNITIEFISAVNKLKNCPIKPTTYAERKKIGIQYCEELLGDDKWCDFFKKHKKKDDLSDAYLQGIWFIKVK